MSISELQGPGLIEAQWQQLTALATTLSPRQLVWVSGFLAGLEHGARAAGGATAAVEAEPPVPGLPAGAADRSLTILYGSETGNGAAAAADLAERARARGLAVALHDMAAYKTRQLKDEQDLLIVTSTYGDGDPPQPAAGFFEFVEGRKAPKLPGLRFAVLALGDSTYDRFCEAGKRLDRRLEELGAIRLQPRIDCDIGDDEPASAWMAEALAALAPGQPRAPAAALRPATPGDPAESFGKHNPFPAAVIENIALTGRGSSKETRHVELTLDGSGLSFEPGDALGIVARNDPALVETLLTRLDLAASMPIELKGRTMPLGQALETELEIGLLTPRFLDHWATLSGAEALQRLSQADERAAFSRSHHVVDVVRRFPVQGIDAAGFVASLRPMQPRLYSIASSLAAIPDEVHLTVSTVRYELHGEPRCGVASGYLAERCGADTRVLVYVRKTPYFRLPADDVPIIMIGAGTGVAPYRAFMQEREARGAPGRSWLVFGERNFRTDFLYQTEWQALLGAGLLTRMDVAFSRDRQGRVYAQDRLKEQARDVFAWLEDGAHLYVCGDATRFAPDVHLALASIVATQGGLGADATEDYLQRLQRDDRYHRDVY